MKIAVLASREDSHFLTPTLRTFKILRIDAYALSIAPNWIDLPRSTIRAFMDEASHYILVANAKSVNSSWFGYAAGNASSRRNGISLLRVDPSWTPPTYLRGFPIFEDVDELRIFFTAQKEEWLLEEARQEARASLLELGISFHAESFAGCIVEGNILAVNLFLDAGFNADSREKHGVTLLGLATRSKHRGVVEALVDRGASLDLQSEDRGYSALMDAAAEGNQDLVDFFLARGSNPNLKSKDGQTALVLAVGRKDPVIVRRLVDKGADPDIADKLGLSARGYASLFKHEAISTILGSIPKKQG